VWDGVKERVKMSSPDKRTEKNGKNWEINERPKECQERRRGGGGGGGLGGGRRRGKAERKGRGQGRGSCGVCVGK
jgi:hypothetical protein